MAITNFIPKIWNSQMLLDFRETAVAANLVNRNYEGDATRGNTVKITTASAVSVKDYKTGAVSDGSGGTLARTTTADTISSTQIDLLIDQEKNFDFYVDDIDRAQAAGSLGAYTQSAAEGMAEDADKFILSTAVTGGTTSTDATTALGGADDAWNVLRDLRKALNKLFVPAGNRVAIVNAEFEAVLLDAASKITRVDTSGTPQGLRDAILGRILGFTVVTSENLPTVDKPQALAFYQPSVGYVSQIEETEAMRAQDKFADRMRGLHVYGGKVVRADGVAVWTDASTG